MKIIRIVLLVMIVIGIGLLFTQKIWVPELVDYILETPKTIIVEGVTCKDNQNYFVVSRNLDNSVGTNILVKYKTNKDDNLVCDYSVEGNDFEIKNENAEYFYAIINNFLILDSGTAPYPRGLIVYDLSLRKKVFEDYYSVPISISGNSITYWNPTNIKVTKENCPKLEEYTSGGLGAGIESYISLDLSTFTKKDLKETRCSARQ